MEETLEHATASVLHAERWEHCRVGSVCERKIFADVPRHGYDVCHRNEKEVARHAYPVHWIGNGENRTPTSPKMWSGSDGRFQVEVTFSNPRLRRDVISRTDARKPIHLGTKETGGAIHGCSTAVSKRQLSRRYLRK